MLISKLAIRSLPVLGVAAALTACGSAENTSSGPSAAAIPVAVMQARFVDSYEQSQALTGRIEASRSSDVGFELAGQLAAVMVDEGNEVAAGAALASLDTDRLRARRAEAAALADQAAVQLELSATTLARITEALEFRGVSQQEYDEAVNQNDSARAALAANRSRLKSIDVDLDKSTLTAPFDAMITRRHVDEGQVLQPGQPVLTLQEKDALTVRIGVAGRALDALVQGSTHDLTVRGESLKATVRQQLPQRDDISGTVDVLLDVAQVQDDTQPVPRPGDLARLNLSRTVAQRGMWVPIEALAEGQRGLWTVYVAVPATNTQVGATHKVEPRPVEIIYQGTDRAFVRGTLAEGDAVIRAGLQRVVPGQFVRLATSAKT